MRKEMGLIVPDESTVQRVRRVAAYKDAETRAAFQAFAEKLPEREVIHLGIDEVHTINTLQLFGGDLRGLTKEGEMAKCSPLCPRQRSFWQLLRNGIYDTQGLFKGKRCQR